LAASILRPLGQQSRPVKPSEHSSNSYDGLMVSTNSKIWPKTLHKKLKTFATKVVLKFICVKSKQGRVSHSAVRAKVNYLSWLECQLVHQFDFSVNKRCSTNWLDLKPLWSWKWASKSSSRSGSGSSSSDRQSHLAIIGTLSLNSKVRTFCLNHLRFTQCYNSCKAVSHQQFEQHLFEQHFFKKGLKGRK